MFVPRRCGDGRKVYGEECDQGVLPGALNGCSKECTILPGWLCLGGDAKNADLCQTTGKGRFTVSCHGPSCRTALDVFSESITGNASELDSIPLHQQRQILFRRKMDNRFEFEQFQIHVRLAFPTLVTVERPFYLPCKASTELIINGISFICGYMLPPIVEAGTSMDFSLQWVHYLSSDQMSDPASWGLRFLPLQCGDGFHLGRFEECDDGNAHSGDGCSSTCQVERGFTFSTSHGRQRLGGTPYTLKCVGWSCAGISFLPQSSHFTLVKKGIGELEWSSFYLEFEFSYNHRSAQVHLCGNHRRFDCCG